MNKNAKVNVLCNPNALDMIEDLNTVIVACGYNKNKKSEIRGRVEVYDKE